MSEKKSKSGSSRSNNKNMIGNIKKIFNRKKHKKNEPTDLQSTSVPLTTDGPNERSPDAPIIQMVSEDKIWDGQRQLSDDEEDENVSSFLTESKKKKKNLMQTNTFIQPNVDQNQYKYTPVPYTRKTTLGKNMTHYDHFEDFDNENGQLRVS